MKGFVLQKQHLTVERSFRPPLSSALAGYLCFRENLSAQQAADEFDRFLLYLIPKGISRSQS
jgi:hypothetical protein